MLYDTSAFTVPPYTVALRSGILTRSFTRVKLPVISEATKLPPICFIVNFLISAVPFVILTGSKFPVVDGAAGAEFDADEANRAFILSIATKRLSAFKSLLENFIDFITNTSPKVADASAIIFITVLFISKFCILAVIVLSLNSKSTP